MTNEATIRVVLVITLVLKMLSGLLYAKREFLKVSFGPNEKSIQIKMQKWLEI